jgi:dTDP-4-dehydrorhamnose reductase
MSAWKDEWPRAIETVEALDDLLSQPTAEVEGALAALDGDIMVLGVGGKMGPSLARLARRAIDRAGLHKRVIGASRFSEPGLREALQDAGVDTIACDLLDDDGLRRLPQVSNIIYMAGMKFGTTHREPQTWAMNAYLPGRVVQAQPQARYVVFSSGNVYPLTPVLHGGATETTPPAPVGEYAQSVLGRERIFQYWAERQHTRGVLFRLNYAVEVRYGVLLDIAQKVWARQPIDLSMGHANVIWQRDANAYALQALALAADPPLILNVTGPETVSIRSVALECGNLLGVEPVFIGQEQPEALLNNALRAHALLGYPQVPVGRILPWVADWVRREMPTLNKPTKFEARDGRF